MRVAVVGGGVYGCVIAIDLARAGATVDLYEARHDILEGATARCQARLHSGYHYPRSDSTAESARDAAPRFAARFPEAIRTAEHHYVIAEDSKVSGSQYLAFLDRLRLPYEVVSPPQVHHAQVCVRVPEALVDVDVLRRLLRRDLALAGVTVHLGASGYEPRDLTVMATYGRPWPASLRYEVCEVALVEVPRYAGMSVVVLDGDHVSLDPRGRAHMLYDVVNSVHAVGEVPDAYRPLLDAWGPVRTPLSAVERMLKTAGRHLRGLDPAGQGVVIQHGSWFSLRAVLPDVDATDERPTLVERHGDVVWVLPGKICTSLDAARRVVELA